MWSVAVGAQAAAGTVFNAQNHRLAAAVTSYLNEDHLPDPDSDSLDDFPLAQELLEFYAETQARQAQENALA